MKEKNQYVHVPILCGISICYRQEKKYTFVDFAILYKLYFLCLGISLLTIFTTDCSSIDLTPTDGVRQCTDRGFGNMMTIPSGMVCYNRTTAGSEAVYICDDGFHQDGAATRVCQSGGVWNGTIPQCLPDPGGQDGITYVSICYCLGIDFQFFKLKSHPKMLTEPRV